MAATTPISAPRMLAGDGIVAFLIFNEFRRRTMGRVYGPENADAMGLTAITGSRGVLAAATTAGAVLSKRPSAYAMTAGTFTVREGAYGVAGAWSREAPLFVLLLAGALVGTKTHPVMHQARLAGIQTMHGARAVGRAINDVLVGRAG
jgi:hypothetical protein